MQVFGHVPTLPPSLLEEQLVRQAGSSDPAREGSELLPARALPGRAGCRGALVGNVPPNFTFKTRPHLLRSSVPVSCHQMFFLGSAFHSPPLCLFCCSVLPESSSSACGEPDFCQRCHRKLHLPHARVALSAFQSSVLIFAILQAPFSLTLSCVVAQRGREERVGWKERRCAQPLPNHPTGSGVGQPLSCCWAG